MILLLSIFTVSFLGIVALLALKLRALSTGKELLSPLIDKRVEYHAQELVMVLRRIYGKFHIDRRRLLILAYVILHVMLRLVELVRGGLESRLRRILNMIKGRGAIKKTGSVSVYLRDVSEYKRQSL